MTGRRSFDAFIGWLRTVAGGPAADERDAPRAIAPPANGDRSGAPPELSPDGRAELSRLLELLDGAGMFAPSAPDPSELAEAVADRGEPMTGFDVLQGLHEAGYYHPGFRIDDHTGRLAFHDDQVEQDTATLRAQVADLDRLAGSAFTVTAPDVQTEWTGGDRTAPTRIGLTIGAESRVLEYRGAVKHLSTVLHVAVARELHARGAPVRLASLVSDSGMWIAALSPDVDVDRLNDDLGAPAYERWEWLDEQQPHAAGETPELPQR